MFKYRQYVIDFTMYLYSLDNIIQKKNNKMILSMLLLISYNQPKLSPCATWNSNGTTVIDKSLNDRENISTNSNESCASLFVDINNNSYCSLINSHVVNKFDSNDNGTSMITVAGTSCPGPTSTMLDHPYGIFVDRNLNLYVADSFNNRIQCFAPGKLNATTIVGFGSYINVTLNTPTGIALDADNHLFIVDSYHHRIIRLIQREIRCLIGCSGESGTTESHLYNPHTMVFDSDGNMFVDDFNNNRIQKFFLLTNSCRKSTNLKVEQSYVILFSFFLAAIVISINAGPIGSTSHAQTICPQVCQQNGMKWTTGWRTTIFGQMSVCDCISES